MRPVYIPCGADTYVASLRGHGLPFYKGTSHQRGSGIGGLFSGLTRAVAPFIAKSLVPAVAKRIGPALIKSGPALVKRAVKSAASGALEAAVGVAQDRLRGMPVKQAAKRRFSAVSGDVLRTMMAPPGKRAYKRAKPKVKRRQKKKKRVRRDVFS